MQIASGLLIIVVFAIITEFIVDIIKKWLPQKLLSISFVIPILSAFVGIGISLLLGLDFFAMLGFEALNKIVAQIFTGIVISAGSKVVYELIGNIQAGRYIKEEQAIIAKNKADQELAGDLLAQRYKK